LASERFAGGSPASEGGQALLGPPTVLSDVHIRQRLDDGPLGLIDIAARDKVGRQWARLVTRPGLNASNELDLVYQTILQRQKAEEEVAVGSKIGHRSGLLVVSRKSDRATERRSLGENMAPSNAMTGLIIPALSVRAMSIGAGPCGS
jgi:hypothetical protein